MPADARRTGLIPITAADAAVIATAVLGAVGVIVVAVLVGARTGPISQLPPATAVFLAALGLTGGLLVWVAVRVVANTLRSRDQIRRLFLLRQGLDQIRDETADRTDEGSGEAIRELGRLLDGDGALGLGDPGKPDDPGFYPACNRPSSGAGAS